MKEKQLTTNVAKGLKQIGCAVYRLDQPRRTMQTPGLSDLYVVHPANGLCCWIELKTGSNTPTDHQRQFIEEVKGAGGQAAVAWSMDDVLWVVRCYAPDLGLSGDAEELTDRFRQCDLNEHLLGGVEVT